MNRFEIMEEFHQGRCLDAYRLFGAHFAFEGCEGVRFTVYAPHARGVRVMGSFNNWNENELHMTRTDFQGVWSVFVPGVKVWDAYRYVLEDKSGKLLYKSDPYAFYSETRPDNASKVYDLDNITWSDQEWMSKRTKNFDGPMNIYEVYAGGWKTNGKYPFTYGMLEEQLLPYVKERGYTHIELMPLNEYPFDGSWGYQASGYFSVTSRYGNPTEFAHFVNACHEAGIGVLMDMVPVHFVKDAFGLRMFDGEPLYEYSKRSDAESQWGTMNFDLWKEEVRSFLMSAASFWCEVYHMDGIRFDAVSNLIFWGGNSSRGVNQGALDFVKRMNYLLAKRYPAVMLIAEDSSDYPKVTWATFDGGLGFDYKWDLGWMNDTLKYYATDPLFRCHDHHKLTFSMAYYYSERFLLPFSHDENVHGKKTIIDRMFGTYEQKFAQARNLYAYMYGHPGKKLNFMGNEIGSFREFDETRALDWLLLQYPQHEAFLKYMDRLNHLYLKHPCMYQKDFERDGFTWIEPDDTKRSIYSFYRENEKEIVVCVYNMTGASYTDFVQTVPVTGSYEEILNSEASEFAGCGFVNTGRRRAFECKEEGRRFPYAIKMNLAPFGAVWFLHKKTKRKTTGEKNVQE